MRKVQEVMGIPISIDIPDAKGMRPFVAAFTLLKQVDQRFSPFKPSSELRQLQAGEVSENELSTDMLEVMDVCRKLEKETNGYFSPFFDGRYDPTGYVKGWAIARVGVLLEEIGFDTYMINAGGDILARSANEHIWRVGLQHPADAKVIMGTVSATNIAVATSGTYERGQHITNPVNRKPAVELLSVTVTGPDIAMADAYATAVFAMGKKGLTFIDKQPGYEALLIGPSLDVHTTRGFLRPSKAKTQSAR